MYDFTLTCRTSEFFCFKWAKPVKIIDDYFFGDEMLKSDYFTSQKKYIFIPAMIEKYSLTASAEGKSSNNP